MMRYHVYASDRFLMTAPLSTIVTVFNLHPDCVRRVQGELDAGTVPNIHFNGRPNALNVPAIQLLKASVL